ncbi:hypothetical protein NDI76_04515 [Halogeometricum sp. S1BR25-6]|uniref:Cox cluster protein n=1 Tax=Halogeometricum salsisoli TaxID=2950536 RepID=A0ABU2GB37_9EURY|nr:hypothetical protein [Halogeometricum sp. S1BR25-6]MDS0297997.1 hypothetical protein [Halogeometricum sp. S1BR25-6]
MFAILQISAVRALGPTPLFPGIPGGPELLVIFLLGFVLGVAPAIFVYYDAGKNDNPHRLLWTVATLIGGLAGSFVGAGIVVVLYLVVGREQGRTA